MREPEICGECDGQFGSLASDNSRIEIFIQDKPCRAREQVSWEKVGWLHPRAPSTKNILVQTGRASDS
jgi:hypothetical protein